MRRLVCLASVALVLLGVCGSTALAGTVKGTVTPVRWAQEVEVCAIGVALSEWCAVPKADGSYVYPGLVGGVAIEFIPTYRSNLLIQYYDHKQALTEASFIGLGPSTVVEGIDADLLEGGRITGVVTSQAGGAALPEVEVCAVSVFPPTLKSCGETDSGGQYSLHSLPSGLYRVGFRGEGTSAGYESTYYEGKSSLAQATSVTVTEGHATAGVDAELVEGGQIMGTVFAAAGGMPLNDIAVCLFADGEVAPRRCSDSAVDGSYAFQGLPSDSYQVGYSLDASETTGVDTTTADDSYASQYYDGTATRAQAATISLLAPGRVEGVDAHLSELSVFPPSVTAPLVGIPVSAGAAVVPEPEPKASRCKAPNHRAKVKGKIRCVSAPTSQKPKKPKKPKRPVHHK